MTSNHIAARALVFNGIEVHDRGEMLCLTDMWKAQGSPDGRGPNDWRALSATAEFVEHVALVLNAGNSGNELFEVKRGGRTPGTWAHWQIALAYAKYLSPEFHMQCNVVIRERMEGKPAGALPNFADPVAAARAWADEYEARVRAERTKAEIGARREATAMNTAAQATKRANALMVELDRSGQWASVKRMEKAYPDMKFDWRRLKRASIEVGFMALDIPDQNYGTVKAYHAAAWEKVYGLEIPGNVGGSLQ